MKKSLVSILLVSTLCLTGCETQHMSYLDKTIYEENTQTLEEDIERTNKEIGKDIILDNIAAGKSVNFDFTDKLYGDINYLDLVNRDQIWCIVNGKYKSLEVNDQMKFLRDIMLIVNDSTENLQQIYNYCSKITNKFGYDNTDLIVNTNLLYGKLKENKFNESECLKDKEKGLNVTSIKFKPTKKQKKKYKEMIKQLRSGKIGDTSYRTSTYEYIDNNCLYYTSYLYARNSDSNRLINTEIFDKMTKEAQKNFLTDICILVNRQTNLRYYGKKNQEKLETAYKDYILSIIQADTGIDASSYMKETWNGDYRKRAVLE